MRKLRIAILESPNPIDLFEERTEAIALAASCRLTGHQVASFFIRSEREFTETVNYLASSDSIHAERYGSSPFVLHISAHGNAEGITFGQDLMCWEKVVNSLGPLIKNADYKGRLALSLSSCDAASNNLFRFIAGAHENSPDAKLPSYIFAINAEAVLWDDALIAWNMLYLKLSRFAISDKGKVKAALKEVQQGSSVTISYHRWDEKRGQYLRSRRQEEI